MIPILYTTYNRIEFTKESLPKLFKNTNSDVLFIIIDTGSTDGTIEYLHNYLKIISNKKYLLFLKKDMTLTKAMSFFFNIIKNYDFEYAAKVDNDTIVPLSWLDNLLDAAKNNKIDILQAKHHILNNNVKDWNEWTKSMKQKKYKDYMIFFNDFVGGSGIVFNKKTMLSFRSEEHTSELQSH